MAELFSDSLKVEMNRVVEEDCEAFASKYGDVLYHYTSTQAMVGIIGKGELQLGCASSMKDTSESKYFIDLLFTALKQDLEPQYEEPIDTLYQKIYEQLETNWREKLSYQNAR